jgi:CBS domain-containing protein
MQAEQQEIYQFIAAQMPFDRLPDEAIRELALSVEVVYFRAGSTILNYGDPIKDLYVIRSGAVEIFRRDGELYNRLDEGGIFGQMSILLQGRVRYPATAFQDTLTYCIPAEVFSDCCQRYENFADYFDESASLRQAIDDHSGKNDMTSVKAATLLSRAPVTVKASTSIQDVAILMSEQRTSALLIDDDDHSLLGIITDQDLRDRVLAPGLDPELPIANVMTTDPITIDANAYVYEAMLEMLRANVSHLPVIQKKLPIGVLEMSDIMRYESQNSLLLVQGINEQTCVEDLQKYSQQVASVFARMVAEDANSHMIGSAMAVIGRTIKQRLIQLAEEKLGPPPVPYCFLALGSMARDEQLLVTDQDNAIIMDNSYDANLHNDYFQALGNFVSDGLAACGYTYCTGGIMASNREWRLTLDEWKNLFRHWIEKPDPRALLNSSIFFDLDAVCGEKKWAQQLRDLIAELAPHNKGFLAALARNTLNRTPPLGFFKDFVVEQDGKQRKVINLKRRGTAPLTDVIRVHALAAGSTEINSFQRLKDIDSAGLLQPGKTREISDALEYISMVRIRHQAYAVGLNEEPDNNVAPDTLSAFERRNLKDAFQVLDNAQKAIKYRYHAGSR